MTLSAGKSKLVRRRATLPTLLAFLLVSCLSAPTSTGPLDQNYAPGEVCMPAGPEGEATAGWDVLVNSGRNDAIIEKVSLSKDSSGLVILGSNVLTVDGDLVGMHLSFPPDEAELNAKGLSWAEAVPAVGARITPTGGGNHETWNLVVGVELDGQADIGITQGFVIEYTVDGRSYVYTTPNRLELRTGMCFDESS